MSQENVEVVEGLYRTFNRRDVTGLLDLLDPDVEWVPVLAVLEGRVYRGHDDVRRWVEDLTRIGSSSRCLMRRCAISATGSSSLVIGAPAGRTSGGESEQPGTWLYEIKRGKVVRLQTFTNRAEALEAVGLSE